MSQAQSSPESGLEPLLAVAVMFTELGERLLSATPADVFNVLTEIAVDRVPGAHAASVTTLRRGKFTTVGATDERARRADALQYDLGSGPCVDAILDQALYRPDDLRHDHRWPEYGRRVSAELGWSSMLSYRLGSDLVDGEMIAGLNIYSAQASAFDDLAVRTGLLLATHGALLMAATTHRDRAEHLDRALRNSRDIGVAIGVLMATHKLTRDQAFDLLRVASQNSNRKISDIAAEVGDTGHLDLRPHRDT